MAASDKGQLKFLTTGPVLRTRAGCRARLRALTLGQQWQLAYHLQCDVRDLDKVLHDLNHTKRISRRGLGDGSLLPEPREGLEGALRRE